MRFLALALLAALPLTASHRPWAGRPRPRVVVRPVVVARPLAWLLSGHVRRHHHTRACRPRHREIVLR